MLEELDFEILRTRHLRAIMELVDELRPDGQTPDGLDDLLAPVEVLRANYLAAQTARDLGRGTVEQASLAMHAANIALHAITKSRYRGNTRVLKRVLRLPVADQTAAQTEVRALAIMALWAALPLPPRPSAEETTAAKFIAYSGMTLAAFTALHAALVAARVAQPVLEQGIEEKEGDVNDEERALREVNTAMLAQARAIFPTGPVAEMLDAVPSEPAQHRPAQPVIASATQTGPGTVRLIYDAEHGTLFDVLDDPPGPVEEVLLLNDTPLKTVDLTGLAPGVHAFTVVAINSRGESDPSDAVSVTVT